MSGDQDNSQTKPQEKKEVKPKVDEKAEKEKLEKERLEKEEKARKLLEEEKVKLEKKAKDEERIIEKAKVEYGEAVKVIEDVYYRFYGGEKFKYKLSEITENLDEYFEAVAIKFSKCKAGSEIAERIVKVVNFDKLGLSTIDTDGSNIEKIINKYPIAIMMTGGVDLKKDLRISTKLIGHIEKAVCTVVGAVSGILGGESVDNLFKPLYTFLIKQGIKV